MRKGRAFPSRGAWERPWLGPGTQGRAPRTHERLECLEYPEQPEIGEPLSGRFRCS